MKERMNAYMNKWLNESMKIQNTSEVKQFPFFHQFRTLWKCREGGSQAQSSHLPRPMFLICYVRQKHGGSCMFLAPWLENKRADFPTVIKWLVTVEMIPLLLYSETLFGNWVLLGSCWNLPIMEPGYYLSQFTMYTGWGRLSLLVLNDMK